MSNGSKLTAAILFLGIISGCFSDSGSGSPRKFFENNKIGSSPDYGVIKWKDPENHVMTVHGFSDDLSSCLIVVKALNVDACKEITDGSACLDPFSCLPLNH